MGHVMERPYLIIAYCTVLRDWCSFLHYARPRDIPHINKGYEYDGYIHAYEVPAKV